MLLPLLLWFLQNRGLWEMNRVMMNNTGCYHLQTQQKQIKLRRDVQRFFKFSRLVAAIPQPLPDTVQRSAVRWR